MVVVAGHTPLIHFDLLLGCQSVAANVTPAPDIPLQSGKNEGDAPEAKRRSVAKTVDWLVVCAVDLACDTVPVSEEGPANKDLHSTNVTHGQLGTNSKATLPVAGDVLSKPGDVQTDTDVDPHTRQEARKQPCPKVCRVGHEDGVADNRDEAEREDDLVPHRIAIREERPGEVDDRSPSINGR